MRAQRGSHIAVLLTACIASSCTLSFEPFDPDGGVARCDTTTEGMPCAGGGTCRAGACCTGCWDGVACLRGNEAVACGGGGVMCRACVAPADMCGGMSCMASRGVIQLSASATHTCAILSDGALYCWGMNEAGQIGPGSPPDYAHTPVRVDGSWKTVAAGSYATCAVQTNGSAWCWGANGEGQLGIGSTDGSAVPAQIAGGLSDYEDIAAGQYFACATRATGEASCWGINSAGQIGNGGTANALSPASIIDPGTLRSITAGRAHACALDDAGVLRCWGDNDDGELGLGDDREDKRVPAMPLASTNWRSIDAGGEYTCGIRTDGSLWCWGANPSLALGIDTGVTSVGTPTQIGDRTWRTVSAGVCSDDLTSCHTCAIDSDGALFCWGANGSGQLGDGTSSMVPVLEPAAVMPRSRFTTVVAGGTHTCAIEDTGVLYCWGSNSHAQIAQPSFGELYPAPIAITFL